MKFGFKRTEVTDSESRTLIHVEYEIESWENYGYLRARGLTLDDLKDVAVFLNGIIEEEEKKKGGRA